MGNLSSSPPPQPQNTSVSGKLKRWWKSSTANTSSSNSRQGGLGSGFANLSNDILLLIVFVVFIAVLVYLIILMNKPSLLFYTLAIEPVKANETSIRALPNSDKLPSLKNGREFAYSFWVYLEGIENNDNYRLVFMRSPGSDGSHLVGANPIVYLDKNSNRMIIKLRTSLADKEGVNATNLDDPLTNSGENNDDGTTLHEDRCHYATFAIDYVPMQSWTNLIINVDNNMVTVFLDGEIYSSKILNENNRDCESDLSKIVSPTVGSILVGNTPDSLPAFNGYISRIQFFNYSLKNPNHISKIYSNGPRKSSNIVNKYLRKTGLGDYGIRSPLYNVKSVADVTSQI
jgi:hypothetical protein